MGTTCPGRRRPRSTEVALTLTDGVRATASLFGCVVGVLGAEAEAPRERRNDNKTIAGFWLAPGARGRVLVNGRPAAFALRTEGRTVPVVLTPRSGSLPGRR